MIDAIFGVAIVFSALGWVFTSFARLDKSGPMFKYLLFATIGFSIFTVTWAVIYGR